MNKINNDIKKNLTIGKEKNNHLKNQYEEISLEKKKKVYSNDKHFSKIYLNTENNNYNNTNKKKNELTNVRSFKSIKIPINNINNLKINNKGNLYNVKKINFSSKNFLFERNNNKNLIIKRNNNQTQSTTSFFKNYSTSTMNKTENYKTENNKTETSELKVMNSYSNILQPKLNISNLKLKKNIKKKTNINDIFKNYKSGLFTLPFVTRLIKND